MDILGLSQEQFKCLILILLRVSIILFMFPVFGGMMVPKPVKAGLALMITIVLFPIVRPDPRLFPESLVGSINLILSELVLGLIIGLTIRLFFAAIQLSGQLIGFQMGFAIANVLDPESGTQGSILAQLGYWVALLCFLILDGHHVLLETLANSFSIIKMGSLGIGAGIFNRISEVSGDMFAMAIKIGAPAIAALLLTSAAFGIIARVVPQVNVLIVAFPIKIVVGLFFFGISLQILLHFTRQYVTGFEGMLTVIMRLMRV
ncbi:MAG: flagellar biosynthetic protein FliR [Deltaproteobacteria bacterium]|nr:flagellar biosynthetic protein FliR [Deltaproteobacteria bacterium]MBW2600733.1 flagellar biosynthetic protein FliR [Deltaproteobacteria bacterium]